MVMCNSWAHRYSRKGVRLSPRKYQPYSNAHVRSMATSELSRDMYWSDSSCSPIALTMHFAKVEATS